MVCLKIQLDSEDTYDNSIYQLVISFNLTATFNRLSDRFISVYQSDIARNMQCDKQYTATKLGT